jgi:hypothetical protein
MYTDRMNWEILEQFPWTVERNSKVILYFLLVLYENNYVADLHPCYDIYFPYEESSQMSHFAWNYNWRSILHLKKCKNRCWRKCSVVRQVLLVALSVIYCKKSLFLGTNHFIIYKQCSCSEVLRCNFTAVVRMFTASFIRKCGMNHQNTFWKKLTWNFWYPFWSCNKVVLVRRNSVLRIIF